MRRAWIDEVRKSQLLDAPERLKGTPLDDAPEHALQLRPLDHGFPDRRGTVSRGAGSILARASARTGWRLPHASLRQVTGPHLCFRVARCGSDKFDKRSLLER